MSEYDSSDIEMKIKLSKELLVKFLRDSMFYEYDKLYEAINKKEIKFINNYIKNYDYML